MNSNPYRDKKLKTKILKYIDSFPCGYITYKNLINKFSNIKKDKINFNLNELKSSKYIDFDLDELNPSGHILHIDKINLDTFIKSDRIRITNEGKSIINTKDLFLNENKTNKGFFISHWQWIVATMVAIVGLYIAYLQLLKIK